MTKAKPPKPDKKTLKLRRQKLDELQAYKVNVEEQIKALESADKKLIKQEKKRVKEITFNKKKDRVRQKLGFFSKWKLKHDPDISYLITMQFPNGTLRTWAIKTKGSTFVIKNNMYYLDYEEAFFDLSMNQFHLFYHYNFAVPINREITQERDEDNKDIKNGEAFWSVTPHNLKGIIDMEYIKTLASQKANKLMTIIIIMAIILVIETGILFLKVGGA